MRRRHGDLLLYFRVTSGFQPLGAELCVQPQTRYLRNLQANDNDEQQEIVFDAAYEIQLTIPVEDATLFVSDAFVTNSQKASYLERLKNSGGTAFQNVTMITVETDATVSEEANDDGKGDSTNIGLIAGAAIASIVMVVLGLALFARRRSKRAQGTNNKAVTMIPTVNTACLRKNQK